MRAPRSLLVFWLLLAALGFATREAQAQFRRSFLIKRPGYFSGNQPEALGPGAARTCAGDLVAVVPNKASDPRLDAIITSVAIVRTASSGCLNPGNATVSGDSFYVTWGGECVQPGDFVILTFTSTAPFAPGGVVWKDQFGTTVANGTFTPLAFPALDPRGMALLAGGLGLLGLWGLRRRGTGSNAI